MTRALHITDDHGRVTRLAGAVAAIAALALGVLLALPVVKKDSSAVTLAHQVRDAEARVQSSRVHVAAALEKLDDGNAVFVAWDTLRPPARREITFVSKRARALFGVAAPAPFPWRAYAERMRDISLGRDADAPDTLDRIRAAIAGTSGTSGMLHTSEGVKFSSMEWFLLEEHMVCVFALRDAEPFYHQLRLHRPAHDEPAAHARH